MSIIENPALVGKSVHVALSDNVEGYITFEVINKYMLNELIIVYYDAIENAIHPLETTLDLDGRFAAETIGTGHYFLLDIAAYMDFLGVDINAILDDSIMPISHAASPHALFEDVDTVHMISKHSFVDDIIYIPSELAMDEGFEGVAYIPGTPHEISESEIYFYGDAYDNIEHAIHAPDIEAFMAMNPSALEIPIESFSSSELEMDEMTVGKTYTFEYTGNVQKIYLPAGRYSLSVWGAPGGDTTNTYGGEGGFSSGEVTLDSPQTLYIVVGGRGADRKAAGVLPGGFNGGGSVNNHLFDHGGASGGGATHIAKRSGTLANLSNFREDVLIVAGGGGGSDMSTGISGGDGGGIEGGSNLYRYSNGGGQFSGGFAYGSGGTNGSFGQGGSTNHAFGGGGGGWYGGSSGFDVYETGVDRLRYNSGGGGSGYIGGVENGITRKYGTIGEGRATITLLELSDKPTYIFLKDGLGRKVFLDRYPSPHDMETDTDNDGIPDSQELIFPPVYVNMSGNYKYHDGVSGSWFDFTIPMYNYHSDPADPNSPGDGVNLSDGIEWHSLVTEDGKKQYLVSAEPLVGFGVREGVYVGLTRATCIEDGQLGEIFIQQSDGEWKALGLVNFIFGDSYESLKPATTTNIIAARDSSTGARIDFGSVLFVDSDRLNRLKQEQNSKRLKVTPTIYRGEVYDERGEIITRIDVPMMRMEFKYIDVNVYVLDAPGTESHAFHTSQYRLFHGEWLSVHDTKNLLGEGSSRHRVTLLDGTLGTRSVVGLETMNNAQADKILGSWLNTGVSVFSDCAFLFKWVASLRHASEGTRAVLNWVDNGSTGVSFVWSVRGEYETLSRKDWDSVMSVAKIAISFVPGVSTYFSLNDLVREYGFEVEFVNE